MSAPSLGLLSPVQTDSSTSLLSHTDTSSNSSKDSLEDGYVFDEDLTPKHLKPPDNLDTCEKLEERILKIATLCAEQTTADMAYMINENEKSKNDEKCKEANNNNSVDVETEEQVGEEELSGNDNASCVGARSKIPKSKTFDASSSVFNNKNSSSLFKSNNGSRAPGSRNHVFMTSHECMVVPGSSRLPRETIASRLRFEKQHSADRSPCHSSSDYGDGYHRTCIPEGYQTPLQRKDILLRDLKRQVRELKTTCEAKDREIAMYKQHVDEETSKLVQAKDEEIDGLREELTTVKKNYEDISTFCDESIAAASVLEQKAADLKIAMTDREREHQKLYLEMYKKGQQTAKFEREEELERLATAGGGKVTISELVKKLAWTELELAKWQTIRRQESYQDAMRPETEADATLRFLKDSFFHYITDERDADHHLRAMIKIFKYTEPQMAKIKQSRLIETIEKRNKKKSKR